MNKQLKDRDVTNLGLCGKQPDVAALQNLLTYALKGLSQVAIEGRRLGVNRFTCEAMFATLSDVDFDPERLTNLIGKSVELREMLKTKERQTGGKADFNEGPTALKSPGKRKEMIALGEKYGFGPDPEKNQDIQFFKHTLIFVLR